MTQPRGRGRPRSTGTLHCVRCQQMVAKIRVRWPDGAVCGACFTRAVNTRGTCAHCATHRLLPGRSPTQEEICRDCAGIATDLTCSNCGREAERIRRGHCASCLVTEDLTAILNPNYPPDLRLHRLIRELASVDRPQSITTWMRGRSARGLLQRIGDRTLGLTHADFDALTPSPAAAHLREMLVHHRILPDRGDARLARFEAWLEARLAVFADRTHIHQPLEQFGRWHHLRRLRADPPPTNMDYATRTAKQEITEAGKFLVWLDTEQRTRIDDLRQAHIDLYWSEGTSTRKHIRNFLQHRRLTGRGLPLKAPARQAETSPMTSTTDRLDAIRRVIEADQVVLSTRIAALIFLLYGVPIGTIAGLHADDIAATPTGMTIALGRQPAPIPEPIIPMVDEYLRSGARSRSTNKNSPWLFPSPRAGQHISPDTLWNRLKIFGIQPLATRNATLFDLAKEIDPATLAALLGYSTKTMSNHGQRAGTNMASYPESDRALRNRHQTNMQSHGIED